MESEFNRRHGELVDLVQTYPGLTLDQRMKLLPEVYNESLGIISRLQEIKNLDTLDDDDSRAKAKILMEDLLHDLKDF